jgi:hypothetical protein
LGDFEKSAIVDGTWKLTEVKQVVIYGMTESLAFREEREELTKRDFEEVESEDVKILVASLGTKLTTM